MTKPMEVVPALCWTICLWNRHKRVLCAFSLWPRTRWRRGIDTIPLARACPAYPTARIYRELVESPESRAVNRRGRFGPGRGSRENRFDREFILFVLTWQDFFLVLARAWAGPRQFRIFSALGD
jgi:hypothetical protein